MGNNGNKSAHERFNPSQTYKFCFVGNGGLKSKFIYIYKNLMDNKTLEEIKKECHGFYPSHNETFEIIKKFMDQYFRISLWDTSGSEEFDKLRPLFYPRTNAFIVCYDICDFSSFDSIITKWIYEIESHCPGLPLFFVGINGEKLDDFDEIEKIKMKGQKIVSSEFAHKVNLELKGDGVFECNLENGKNIIEIYDSIISEIFSKKGSFTRGKTEKEEISRKRIGFKGDYLENKKAKRDIPKDYFGFSTNFYCVLFNDEFQNAFKEHLNMESNPEPFMFMHDHQQFLISPSHENFINLIEKYFLEKSPYQLNISGSDKKNILITYENNKDEKIEDLQSVFKNAYQTILLDLRCDVWPRFTSSEKGYEMFCKYSYDESIISHNPFSCMKGKFYTAFTQFDRGMISELSQILLKSELIEKELIKDLNQISIELIFHDKISSDNYDTFYTFKDQATDTLNCYPALLIDGILFEWNSKELIIPRKYEGSPFYHEKLKPNMIDISKIKQNLSLLLFKYNNHYNYQKTYGATKYRNEFNFIEDTLKIFIADFSNKSIIEKMKKKGKLLKSDLHWNF